MPLFDIDYEGFAEINVSSIRTEHVAINVLTDDADTVDIAQLFNNNPNVKIIDTSLVDFEFGKDKLQIDLNHWEIKANPVGGYTTLINLENSDIKLGLQDAVYSLEDFQKLLGVDAKPITSNTEISNIGIRTATTELTVFKNGSNVIDLIQLFNDNPIAKVIKMDFEFERGKDSLFVDFNKWDVVQDTEENTTYIVYRNNPEIKLGIEHILLTKEDIQTFNDPNLRNNQ
jgi:hypothetical protein